MEVTEEDGVAPLYVAVTGRDLEAGLLTRLEGLPVGIKVGLELFTAMGPPVCERVRDAGYPLFLDLKLHDIPFTVSGAVRSACSMRPELLNVHGLGGVEMMRAAAEAVIAPTRVIAVTVLTSMSSQDLGVAGDDDLERLVVDIALRAMESGLSGVVCSPLEAASVRRSAGEGFLIVTPGIRPAPGGDPGRRGGGLLATPGSDDQKRKTTPGEAIRSGATSLVVGRPITASPDPRTACIAVLEEIDGARSPEPDQC